MRSGGRRPHRARQRPGPEASGASPAAGRDQLLDAAPALHAFRPRGEDVGARVGGGVALLEEQPVALALARLALQPRQHPAAVELLARQAELEGAAARGPWPGPPSAPRRRCPRRSSARRRTRPSGSRPRSRCIRAGGPRSPPPGASRPDRARAPSAPPSSSAPRRARAAGRSGRRWRGACAPRSGCRRPRPPRPPARWCGRSRAWRGRSRACASPGAGPSRGRRAA